MTGLDLLLGIVVFMVFGLAAILLLVTFTTLAVAWTGIAFAVFREEVWRPACKWLNQPCCESPRRETFIVQGASGSQCRNCGHVKISPFSQL